MMNGRRNFSNIASKDPSKKENIGICAVEVYFPKSYVHQEDLEKASNVSPGKHTIGLGQTAMAFAGDHEDINSISLTAVSNLLEKYNISPHEIGRLEVGTETFVDKSKSTKTVLMDLFEGNEDIEGTTVVNACYGGTAALFNAIHWVESSSWDGRYALVVAADIAVYAEGAARPTGGCGAVAILIGPNAPIKVDLSTRTSYASHTWDFFKPKLEIEYPEVNGQLSNFIYLQALDSCYKRFIAKQKSLLNVDKSVNNTDHVLFHTPYNKLVQKSLSRLLFLDATMGKLKVEGLEKFLSVPLEQTIDNKEIEAALKSRSASDYTLKVKDSAELSKQIGNTYTASLYMNLACLISKKGNQLANKNLLMFSYGSGSIASMFEVFPQPAKASNRFTLESIQSNLDIENRLAKRDRCPPADLSKAMALREKAQCVAPFKPTYSPDNGLFPGTYYLSEVNSKFERIYKRTPGTTISSTLPKIVTGIMKVMK